MSSCPKSDRKSYRVLRLSTRHLSLFDRRSQGLSNSTSPLNKLLLIGPSPARAGGVATYLRHLTSALDDCASTHWTFFATDKGGTLTLRERLSAGLRVARALRGDLRDGSHRLAHICCGSDVSGWGLREGLLHAGLCRRAGLRVLLHLHASALPQLLSPSRPERPLLMGRLHAMDALAVPSMTTRDLLLSYGLRADRICVLPNSVPLLPWSPNERSEDAPLQLVLVGSIEERKGIDVLLDALSKVAVRRPGALRVDAFGPSEVSAVQFQNWQKKGSSVGLQFHGAVSPEAVHEALVGSDGLLLPSLAECQPFALLEAMSASRPVIASETGGIAHLLRNDAGECVPPGDARTLAATLEAWIDAPQRRQALARTGWERVRDEHSLAVGLAATAAAWKLAAGKRWTAGSLD